MLTIIGCGNANRRDDAAGVAVAARLQAWLHEHPRTNVRVFDAGTGGMEVMFQARGSDSLVIVDANQSGSTPGAIFEVPGETLRNLPEPGYTLHDFRWDHALFVGHRIFREDFPADVTVFLIEAEDLSLGLGLSGAVEQAVCTVVDKLSARIARECEAA